MFNTIILVISVLLSIFGLLLASFYAFSIRRKSIESYIDNQQVQKIDQIDSDNKQVIEPIRLFIYLDEEKMYSLSSQLFEGITNEIMKGDASVYGLHEEQKGEYLSGSFMANMMFQQNSFSESRSLNDFAYILFEQELNKRGILYTINEKDTPISLKGKGFVKVTGRITINDYSTTLGIIENFNQIGKAIGSLENGGKKVSSDQLLKNGLALDEELKKSIEVLLSNGYKNKVEVVNCLSGSNCLFTSLVNRQYLKESEEMIVSKYTRFPERPFTIVGLLSQAGESLPKRSELENTALRARMHDINTKISGMENAFNGRASNECIIDPIAIYTEI